MKIVILASLGLVACATQEADDRPRTTAYVTEAVLGPTCGKAECHSTFSAEENLVLDTTAGVNSTLHRLLAKDGNGVQSFISVSTHDTIGPILEDQPLLFILNAKTDAGGTPMPYDAPMPSQDVQLILDWIVRGTPGSCTSPTDAFCFGGVRDQAGVPGVTVTCGADRQFVFTEGCSL